MNLLKPLSIPLLFSILLIGGCQPANKPPADQATPGPQQKINYTERVKTTDPQNPQQAYPRKTQPDSQYNKSPQEKAERLVKIAKGVPHVKDATAISAGNYTIIGIDVDNTLERDRVGTVKYTVAQAVKEDPNGGNALVTADADLVERVRKVNEEVQKGRPISGLMDELAAIAGRIMPQPSQDIPNREE